jgi:NhaP-type Na+/H+ or K+/H+ antiporter
VGTNININGTTTRIGLVMKNHRDAYALAVFVVFLIFEYAGAASNEERVLSSEEANASNSTMNTELVEPYIAILFPWFIEMIGIIAFFFITRYFSLFPYTAIMFIIGTFMGIAVNRVDRQDQLSESIRMWVNINSEVLLLVFLPGLIFHDAYSLNVHLFQASFWQCCVMAFPMVLAGTVLTACVAFYIFPYGWSFNLAMTFGSILSATDPVAVSALLGEVGAPPRLKMHISGESLLNDGTHA